MDIEKLIRRLRNDADAYRNGETLGRAFADQEDVLDNAATALSTLQSEKEKLRAESIMHHNAADNYFSELTEYRQERNEALAELEQVVQKYETAVKLQVKMTEISNRQMAELEQVKAERDAAVEAVKNMAEYIVCAGRVDYFLCDEISQEHHLKYQPKNDGNYDNEPCYKCVADWFLQGHKWQESE